MVFVATKAGAYAVKASSRPAEEYFATMVLRGLGVRTPEVRMVSHVQSEWRDIKTALRSCTELMRKRGDTVGAETLQARLNGPLDRAQLMVMSLLSSSQSLENNPGIGKLLVDSEVELRMLGRCLASDVLLNNWDRCRAPCWDNEGNGGNFLFQVSRDTLLLFAIDSVVTSIIGGGPNAHTYANRARGFMEAVCEGTEALDPIRRFISDCTCCSPVSLEAVRTGMLEVLANFASHDAVRTWLLSLRAEVAQTIAIDWANVWAESVKLIDPEFLEMMVGIFRDVASKHRAILPQAENPWLSKHSVEFERTVFGDESHISKALLDALPEEMREELLYCHEYPFKVLLLQEQGCRSEAGAKLIESALQDDLKRTGHETRMVILPENFVSEMLTGVAPLLADKHGRAVCGEAPPELQAYAAVAARHQVYIVCGSAMEPESLDSHRFYVTTVVLGPDGLAVGAYRKREIHRHDVQLQGDRPLVFGVPGLGKVAVLICLDAENRTIRDEVVGLNARVVVNPIRIPSSVKQTDDQWRVSLESIGEQFEHMCRESGITWLRCDMPYPQGRGTSQAIGPERTQQVASMRAEALPVLIMPELSSELKLKVAPAGTKTRTRKESNCGARCTVSGVRLPDSDSVIGMGFTYHVDSKGARTRTLGVDFQDGTRRNIDVPTTTVSSNTVELSECEISPPRFDVSRLFGVGRDSGLYALSETGSASWVPVSVSFKSVAVQGDTVVGVRKDDESVHVVALGSFCLPVSSSESMQSVAVWRDIVYGVGADNAVYKQSLSAFETDTAWELVSASGVKAVAVHEDTIYAVGLDFKVYQQCLATASPSSEWFSFAAAGVESIAVEGDVIFGVGLDGKVYGQALREVSESSSWHACWSGVPLQSIAARVPGSCPIAPPKSQGIWLNASCTHILRISDGAIRVVYRGRDGQFRRPLSISTVERVQCVAVDHMCGGFAVWSPGAVYFWSFGHNRLPFPLTAFLVEGA